MFPLYDIHLDTLRSKNTCLFKHFKINTLHFNRYRIHKFDRRNSRGKSYTVCCLPSDRPRSGQRTLAGWGRLSKTLQDRVSIQPEKNILRETERDCRWTLWPLDSEAQNLCFTQTKYTIGEMASG